jgi:Putative Actinobacterial Holin-X, holin superfamily III
MTDTTPRSSQQNEESLGALFATATRDLSALVHSEIELAKAEIRSNVKHGVAGGAMFGAAALFGVLSLFLLLFAAVYGLVAAGLDTALAFLIVAVVLLAIAGLLILVGKRSISRLGPPERTIRTSRDTAAFLKSPRSGNAQSTTG